LVGILSNLKKCCSESDNLDKLIFVSKNWFNNPRVGCSSPFCLVKLIKVDVVLEEEAKQYEGEF
jgi:hypothetical protein